eukprot:jgi/Undpi1/2096/HiC_scaffold_12.g05482.m1
MPSPNTGPTVGEHGSAWPPAGMVPAARLLDEIQDNIWEAGVIAMRLGCMQGGHRRQEEEEVVRVQERKTPPSLPPPPPQQRQEVQESVEGRMKAE